MREEEFKGILNNYHLSFSSVSQNDYYHQTSVLGYEKNIHNNIKHCRYF